MPKHFLAIGHVTWDRRDGADVLGGSVSYSSLTARALGWEAAIVTRAGPEFRPESVMPGITAFVEPSAETTRFRNEYHAGGRTQWLLSRADDVDPRHPLGDWRSPSVLLLAPVIDEVPPHAARHFDAGLVGAVIQGWLRQTDEAGRVSALRWADASAHLEGVDVLFLSENDLPDAERRSRELLADVPVVALTRGVRGVTLLTRDREEHVATVPRAEVDPTGAGDVFAAAFLVAYSETRDLSEAAAFASCAASFVIEGVGASCLGDRSAVARRMEERRRYLDQCATG